MAAKKTTFPVTGRIDLLARLGHGSVSVAARDGLTEATVRLTPTNENSDLLDRITVELRGSTLMVAGPRQGGLADLIGGWRRGCDAVDAVIDVPTGTPIKIVTASARITTTGRCGSADIATGTTAQVRLDTVAGDLLLRYGNADSDVGTVTGSVQLRAGKGGVHLHDVFGRLDCGLGGGNLTVDVARSALRVRAGSGSVFCGRAHDDVDIALGSGTITIGLPAGTSARVDATSGSRQVHSDLPVESAPTPGTRPCTVRARTGSGVVRLLRASAAA